MYMSTWLFCFTATLTHKLWTRSRKENSSKNGKNAVDRYVCKRATGLSLLFTAARTLFTCHHLQIDGLQCELSEFAMWTVWVCNVNCLVCNVSCLTLKCELSDFAMRSVWDRNKAGEILITKSKIIACDRLVSHVTKVGLLVKWMMMHWKSTPFSQTIACGLSPLTWILRRAPGTEGRGRERWGGSSDRTKCHIRWVHVHIHVCTPRTGCITEMQKTVSSSS